jgi:hypothetical protein
MQDMEMGDVKTSDGAATVATASTNSSGGETIDTPEPRDSFSEKEHAYEHDPQRLYLSRDRTTNQRK